MGKYLKSYKSYPAGTLVVAKDYNLWQRFWMWLTKKRRIYNSLFVLPIKAVIGVNKIDLLINDYYLFIPKKPFTKKELKKLDILLRSCQTTEDYMATISAIRPSLIDTSKNLEQLRNNENFTKIYLDTEPFQEVKQHDNE